jgi:hypothetical protein
MTDRAAFQTELSVRGHQGIAGHLRVHRAIAHDDMREDRECRFARGALKTSDSDPTQKDTHVMRVGRQASAAATARLV